MRGALAINPQIQRSWANEWQAWAAWRAAAEKLGVLVFQVPKVPLAEARGISLLRAPLPVAAVNSKDGPESRAFTLIHEVVHLMWAAGLEESPAARETRSGDAWAAVEPFAEEAASHTIAPKPMLVSGIQSGGFPRNGWNTDDVRTLARRFKLTPVAMATRLRASGYFDWAHYQAWKSAWDGYVTTLKPRAGGFARSVIAQPSQTVDYVFANPPFGKKSSMTSINEEGRAGEGGPRLQSAGFLGHHLQQAAQLSSTHPLAPKDHRPRHGRAPRQRPF